MPRPTDMYPDGSNKTYVQRGAELYAELSADGGAWQPLTSEDGLLDGQSEVLIVDRPAEAKLLLLRVTDAAFNTMTFDLTRVTR